MTRKKYPVYAKNKQVGNIAEALVQYLLSKFCLVHKIDGSNDIGNDFICELIKDKYPTNLLFYVQVKFRSGTEKPHIREETLNYWEDSPIPVFVFWIKSDNPPNTVSEYSIEALTQKWVSENICYARFTPVSHKDPNFSQEYIQFNKHQFIRDLFEDYARTQTMKGSVPIIEPRDFMSLNEKIEMNLPRYMSVNQIIPTYEKQIKTKSWSTILGLGIILQKSNKPEDKKLAKACFTLSKALINKNFRDHKRKAFLRIFREYEAEEDIRV